MADRAPTNPITEHPSRNKRHKVPHWLWLLGGFLVFFQGCVTTPSVSIEDEARSQAKISYLLGDYQRTLSIVLPRAEAGEAWAQYTLGYMYYYGRGLAVNKDTAKRWIESAAAKKYVPAQQALKRISAVPPKQPDLNDKTIVPGATDNGATTSPQPGGNDNQTKPAMTAPPPIPTQQTPTAASTAKQAEPAAPPKTQTPPTTPADPQ